jgi:osmotically-inducible protein OsmY
MFPTILPPTLVLVPACLAAAVVQTDRDARIISSARSSYNFRVHLKDDAIDLACQEGVVTLTGMVANEFHKTLAEETVKYLPGVKSVDNRLLLRAEASGTSPDLWLATKVKMALRYQKHIGTDTIQVEARSGVVTLSGQTGSRAEKELAEDIVQNIDGVKQVENDLRIVTPGKKTLAERIDDASITAAVKTVLLAHRGTSMLSTHVKTDRGVVTLRGQARNPAEKALVARLVTNVRGVQRISNRMTVAKTP